MWFGTVVNNLWYTEFSRHVTVGLLLPPETHCFTLSILLLLLYDLGIASIGVFNSCNFCCWQWIDILHMGVHCLCCDYSSCKSYEAFIVTRQVLRLLIVSFIMIVLDFQFLLYKCSAGLIVLIKALVHCKYSEFIVHPCCARLLWFV